MAKKSRPAPQASAEALDTLVQQFSQPLAFLRELIQNSLDAATNRIEVEVVYDEGESCARVQVTDWGEGMNREVIDTQLTRLFSSTKEGDLTRIGKFGIGFVSIFAPNPKAVVVDSGRDGEYWRVLFHPDRSFERLQRHEPIEGTRVTSYIPVARNRFDKFRQECLQTVVYWCKHCDVEIRFNGKPINQPFELGLPAEVRLEVPGSEVVAAPSLDDEPFYGFYNRGLTLLEGTGSPRPGVSFKLRSMYLEHTLTRDNVVQDKHYEKAMAVLDRAVTRLLPVRLFQELASRPDDVHLWKLAVDLAGRHKDLPPECLEFKLFPSHGGTLALGDLKRASQVAWSPSSGPLIESLMSQRVAVLTGEAPWPLELARQFFQVPLAEEHWFLAQPLEPGADLAQLLEVANRLLPGPRLQGGDFSQCGRLASRVSLTCSTPGRAEPVGKGGKQVLVNLQHPLVEDLSRVVTRDPSLAGYLLGRAVLLETGRKLERQLLQAAIKRRQSP
jgi:hypothetical protein